MSVTLQNLVEYLDNTLAASTFQDYCPNGLQVEGKGDVVRLATGVTACQALVDAAIAWGADALLVHHGYFWRGEAQPVVGMKRRRLGALLRADVSLLAYHLPLDAHPELGNNAQFGQKLGIEPAAQRPLHRAGTGVGNIAGLAAATSAAELVTRVEALTGRTALHIGDGAAEVRCLAWCTGAAQDYIEAAHEAGADMYITGEVSEQTVHFAREQGMQFVAAGHHATERYGVQAVGAHLAETFSLEHQFIDIDNPV